MAIGRKTGGRTKGTPNRATARRESEIAQSGITPLQYMLKVMRDEEADKERRDDMAKAAAPYVHPKLASMQHTGKGGGPIQTVNLTDLTQDDLERLESLFGNLAHSASDDAEDDTGGEG